MSNKILEPIEREVEIYTKDDYNEMLNDWYGPIKIAGISFDPSRIFEELDPIAYSCGFDDIQEYETKYECPICGCKCDNYNTAKWCCQDDDEEIETDYTDEELNNMEIEENE